MRRVRLVDPVPGESGRMPLVGSMGPRLPAVGDEVSGKATYYGDGHSPTYR
jgi:hypothetical protein